MRISLLIALGTLASCELTERDDFMIGRRCAIVQDCDAGMGNTCTPRQPAEECDPGQRCLPHAFSDEGSAVVSEARCRSAESFSYAITQNEPPLAFCRPGLWECPEGVECGPDRVRWDAGVRRLVCRSTVKGVEE